MKQLGGGFGGKGTRPNFAATAAAVAAYNLRKPVKVFMDLNDCMNMIGKRPSWYVKYSVGVEDDGKLSGIYYEFYSDPGVSQNGSLMFICNAYFDNGRQFSKIRLKKRFHLIFTKKLKLITVQTTW